MSNTTSLYMNLLAAVWCGVALIMNIMAGNVFFIVLMSALIPMNLTTAYKAFNRMIKEKSVMKQLAGENENVGN
jgi:hypothetical protein